MAKRRFGKIRTLHKTTGLRAEASYPTPVWALERNPSLPQRFTKTLPVEYTAELEKWLLDAEQAIMTRTWQPPTRYKRKDITHNAIALATYANDYWNTHVKPNGEPLSQTTRLKQREWLNNYILPYLGKLDMRRITSQDVEKWWEEAFIITPDGRGQSARWNAYTYLRSIFEHAVKTPLDDTGRTLIQANPCRIQASKPRVKHKSLVADMKELHTLAQSMPDNLSIVIYLGGVVGLREGEICALTRKDINLDERIINVDKSVKSLTSKGTKRQLIIDKPKTRSSVRTIPFPDWLTPILSHHLDTYVDEADDALIIYGTRNHSLYAPQTLRARWYKALAAVPRLQGMHFHDLRHTALTHWGEAGASIGQLMQIAGHSQVSTVAVYQQSSREANERLRNRLNEQTQSSIRLEEENHQSETAETDGIDPLITVLVNLPVGQQADILKTLSKERQAHIIQQLPPHSQTQLLPQLL